MESKCMLINNPRIVLRTERSKLQSSRLTVTSRLHVLASISEKFVRNYLGDAEYEHTSTLESFLSAMKVRPRRSSGQRCCCLDSRVVNTDLNPSYTDFPENMKIWTGGDLKYLGSGIKYKKIAFFSVQIYKVALYVETAPASAELKRLQKEGFFKDFSDDTLCDAAAKGVFKKVLQIQLLRNVSVSQFDTEISKSLKPRLAKTGDEDLYTTFIDYIRTKSLAYEASLLALWDEENTTSGGLFPPGFNDFAHAKVGLQIDGASFAHALFDMYIGHESIVPDAKKQWAQSVLALLKS